MRDKPKGPENQIVEEDTPVTAWFVVRLLCGVVFFIVVVVVISGCVSMGSLSARDECEPNGVATSDIKYNGMRNIVRKIRCQVPGGEVSR